MTLDHPVLAHPDVFNFRVLSQLFVDSLLTLLKFSKPQRGP